MMVREEKKYDWDTMIFKLQCIRTWAEVEQNYDGIDPKTCAIVVGSIDKILDFLNEQKGGEVG